MAGFTLNETIARPPVEVFDFIADPVKAAEILPSVTGTVKLTDGPVGVGTRYREHRMMNGKEGQAELEVVGYDPGRSYAVRNVTEGITTIYRYTIEPAAGATRIELECEVSAGGVKKLMVPIVVSVLKKEDGGHLQRLKAVMES